MPVLSAAPAGAFVGSDFGPQDGRISVAPAAPATSPTALIKSRRDRLSLTIVVTPFSFLEAIFFTSVVEW
jgi:hypothetical protein